MSFPNSKLCLHTPRTSTAYTKFYQFFPRVKPRSACRLRRANTCAKLRLYPPHIEDLLPPVSCHILVYTCLGTSCVLQCKPAMQQRLLRGYPLSRILLQHLQNQIESFSAHRFPYSALEAYIALFVEGENLPAGGRGEGQRAGDSTGYRSVTGRRK